MKAKKLTGEAHSLQKHNVDTCTEHRFQGHREQREQCSRECGVKGCVGGGEEGPLMKAHKEVAGTGKGGFGGQGPRVLVVHSL